MNENDKQFCEQTASPTAYDLGLVKHGPPPLQACNSCKFFQHDSSILNILKPICGVCQYGNHQAFQNLDSTCWLFQNKFIVRNS